jgi:hypothetical protein
MSKMAYNLTESGLYRIMTRCTETRYTGGNTHAKNKRSEAGLFGGGA